MKNILILASCLRSNIESGLWSAVKDTWADIVIKNKYENVRFYGYCFMSDEERHQSPHETLGCILSDEKLVLVPQGDDLFSSFDRMRSAMRTLVQYLQWADYVLLTNCSTYINVPLLNDFVQQIDQNDFRVFCGRVISAQYMSGPYSWCFYGEGSAILLNKLWTGCILNNENIAHASKNDHVSGEKKWLFYKRNVTDTAIGCLIDDLLLSDDDIASCLEIIKIEDGKFAHFDKLDHTLFWQDWGQDKPDEEQPQMWPLMGSVDCRGKDDKETASELKMVHEEVKRYYEENNYQTDMRYIDAYVNNPQTPVVTKSLDKPDCCIDDYEKVPFDDYHEWLEENSDIPNLNVDENGHLVEARDSKPKKNTNPYDQWGQIIPDGMTYAEYFNIPFWDHKCWYKHPWAGQNFCGCCQKEQLVYPQGSPSHEHDGTDDCGCHGGSGSGSGSGSKDKCYDRDVI